MEFQTSAHTSLQLWNRKLLNLFWIITITSCVLELLYAPYTRSALDFYIKNHVLLPTISIIIGLAILEIIYLQLTKYQDYIVILSAVFIFTTLIATHYRTEALIMALFFPMMISVYYFQKSRVYFAALISISSFLLLFLFHSGLRDNHSLSGFIAMFSLLVFGTVICVGIMNRGQEAIEQLTSTLEAKQELLVKTILMDKISKTDALTDLYNHISFHEFLDKVIEQVETNNNNLSLQVAVIDIDNFKKINDTYGHRAGDKVLQRVAAIIKSKTDPNDFAARYGGEEFAIIFTEKAIHESYGIVETIRITIAETSHEELDGNPVTVSVGLQAYRKGEGKEKVFTGADASLYLAKKTGKNKTVVSNDHLVNITSTIPPH